MSHVCRVSPTGASGASPQWFPDHQLNSWCSDRLCDVCMCEFAQSGSWCERRAWFQRGAEQTDAHRSLPPSHIKRLHRDGKRPLGLRSAAGPDYSRMLTAETKSAKKRQSTATLKNKSLMGIMGEFTPNSFTHF